MSTLIFSIFCLLCTIIAIYLNCISNNIHGAIAMGVLTGINIASVVFNTLKVLGIIAIVVL